MPPTKQTRFCAELDILEKFKKLIKFYGYHQTYCGCEVMDPNYRLSWRTFFAIFCCVLYYACSTNLIVNHPEDFLKSFATFGLSTQGACKLYMAIKDHKVIADMVEDYRKFYLELITEGPKSRRYQVLNKHVDLCILLYKIYTIMITITLSLCPLYPIAMYIIYKKFEYILAIYVPFVDPWSGIGFTVNSTYHVFCMLLLGNGSLAADNGFILYVIHFAASTNLMSVQIDELNEFLSLSEEEVDHTGDMGKAKEMINDIIAAHQKIILNIKKLDKLFFTPIAVQIFTAVFSFSIALFLAATTNYLPSYALLMISLFQLVLYCCLGSIIDKKSDDLCLNVYEINWYLLPIEEQNKMLMLLRRTQKSLTFYIAGLMKLNVDTCVEILKKIYSCFMLMMNSV